MTGPFPSSTVCDKRDRAEIIQWKAESHCGGEISITCAGALVPAQSMQIYGEKARILVEIPFNPLPDRPARIIIDDGRDLAGSGRLIEEFPIVNQCALQADRFADAIRGVGDVPVSVHDAVRNMEVIDALFRKGV